MKALPNDIVLRPRFQIQLDAAKESALNSFENAIQEPFLVKRIDDHVFIKFNKKNMHFWSPQLHLEINEVDDNNSRLYGLFGPNPTLWTFFIFIHFGVGTFFVIFGIWGLFICSLGRALWTAIGSYDIHGNSLDSTLCLWESR